MFTDPNAPDYLFGNKEFTSSSEYLDTWSRYDQNSFCLAMLFGYRELDDGVLGLAWVAGTNQVGGICQKRVSENTIELKVELTEYNKLTLSSFRYHSIQDSGISTLL